MAVLVGDRSSDSSCSLQLPTPALDNNKRLGYLLWKSRWTLCGTDQPLFLWQPPRTTAPISGNDYFSDAAFCNVLTGKNLCTTSRLVLCTYSYYTYCTIIDCLKLTATRGSRDDNFSRLYKDLSAHTVQYTTVPTSKDITVRVLRIMMRIFSWITPWSMVFS